MCLVVNSFRKICFPVVCKNQQTQVHLYLSDFQYKPADLSELLKDTKKKLLQQKNNKLKEKATPQYTVF
jgi:hypothetical protein